MRIVPWQLILTAFVLMALAVAVMACGTDEPEATPVAPAATTPPATSPPTGTTPEPAATDQPAEPTATAVPPSPENPFVIGVMESITGPGETYGNVAVQAKQMAVDEINAAGGINGRELKLIVEDSKCAAQDAITAYRKLTDTDGVKIILGTSCSGAMLGAAPLAEEDGVVLFSGLATNPDIANAGDYIFRTAMSDQQLGIDTGNVMWTDGVRTVATITEATDYAEGVRRTTVEQFQKLGGSVVGEERYASDITDFRTQLTKLLGENPDAIHIASQSEFTGGTIIKQLDELGYDGPIYSEIVPVGTTALEIAGDAATGLKAIIADIDPANAKGQEVLANFRERYDYLTLPWYLGSRLRRCVHRRRVPEADQRRPGRRRLPRLPVRHHLERGHRRQLQLRRAWARSSGCPTLLIEVLPPGRAQRREPRLSRAGPGCQSEAMAMGTAAPVSDEPFVIGAMDALTGVGESYGNPIQQAKLLAVEEINAAGGINGRPAGDHLRRLQVRRRRLHHGLQQADGRRRSQDHPGHHLLRGHAGGRSAGRRRGRDTCCRPRPPARTSPWPATSSSARPSTTCNWASTSATRCGWTAFARPGHDHRVHGLCRGRTTDLRRPLRGTGRHGGGGGGLRHRNH